MKTIPRIEAPEVELAQVSRALEGAAPEEIVAWAAGRFGDGLVLSTSFGIQSALMLHLATQVVPRIPVVWVDTGYLPPETYRFADELTRRLDLNLHLAQPELSPARMEALHGRLFEERNVEALSAYDRMRKVQPMQRALRDLGATAWLSGLRRDQTDYRKSLPVVGAQEGRAKILPILGFTSKDVHAYLKAHDLPYHPLFDQGYATVGDWHSSRPVGADDENERDTRFGGLKQECGIHLPQAVEAPASASLH